MEVHFKVREIMTDLIVYNVTLSQSE